MFSFQFNESTLKYELSCSRFEFETLDFIRDFAKRKGSNERKYHGFVCTNIGRIKVNKEYAIVFTPKLHESPKNYFHTDIHDLIFDGNAQLVKTILFSKADSIINRISRLIKV